MKTALRAIGLLGIGAMLGLGFSTCKTTNGAQGTSRLKEGVISAVGRAVLPSPAFAQSVGHNVSIADIAERTVASVVNISSEKVVHPEGASRMSPFFSDPFSVSSSGGGPSTRPRYLTNSDKRASVPASLFRTKASS